MSEPVHIHPPPVHHDPVRAALDCLAEGFQIIDADWKVRGTSTPRPRDTAGARRRRSSADR